MKIDTGSGWRWGIAVLAWALGAATWAQDVSLSPLQWADLRDPPDQLPTVKTSFRVGFPAGLKTTSDVGYVLYEVMVDAKGNTLGLNPHATLENYLGAIHETMRTWTFASAKRAGKPVNSEFIFAVIFNPSSAAAGKPDATPRLLEAAPVRLDQPKGAGGDTVVPDQVIPVEVKVDVEGKVTEIVSAPDGIRRKVEIAMKNWRFAPAQRGGQAVEAQIRVPVIGITAVHPSVKKTTQPPRVTYQEKPIYPLAMRASGMRGEVVVDFIVDIEGRVRNAFVVRSLNPAFDDPALEAVRRWKFEPALVDEKPKPMHMQVPIIFALSETFGGGKDGMTTSRKPDLSKLPPEFRYDTAPKLRGSVRAVYPYAALTAGRKGRAIVQYMLNEKGKVLDARVAEASAPEFGQALLAAIEQFEYEPALKDGKPCKAIMAFSQEFDDDRIYQLVSDDDEELLRREKKKRESIVGIRELDQPPKPLSQRPPKFPLSLRGKATKGTATVEFLIDADGRARLARVIDATDEALGYAAVQGVSAWHFEPPTRGGRAAVARVQIPIEFGQ